MDERMMMTSMSSMSLPGDTFLYLATIRAMMSVPPELPPCDIAIAMPTPVITPPMIVDSIFPLDTAKACVIYSGMRGGITFSMTEVMTMAYTVLPPNPPPMILKPISSRMRLMTK